LVKEEGGLEMGEFPAGGTGGASLGKPRFSRGVITFEEVDWVGVEARSSSFEAMEVAAQHCYKLHCVF
jgi:hypothetical protein